eukprot:Awhi_evm1s4644
MTIKKSNSFTSLALVSLVFSSVDSLDISDNNVGEICRARSLALPRSSSLILCAGNNDEVCNTEYYECIDGEASVTSLQVPDGMVCFDGELITTFTECLNIEDLDDEDEINDIEPTQSAIGPDEPVVDEDDGNGTNTAAIAGGVVGGLVALGACGGLLYKFTGESAAAGAAVIDTSGPVTVNQANPLGVSDTIGGENVLFAAV